MSIDTEEKVVLTVPEAGRVCRISRQNAYTAVRKGLIPSIKIGRRLLVPRARLLRMLEGEDGKPAVWESE